MVETTQSDEEADVVDAGVDRDVDFLPDLVVFLVFAKFNFTVLRVARLIYKLDSLFFCRGHIHFLVFAGPKYFGVKFDFSDFMPF